jgi:hypothetical protein
VDELHERAGTVTDGITSSSIIRRSSDHIATDMPGETVVLDMRSGMYYGMEHVGALIWRLLEEPRTLAEIQRAVLEEYDVDADQCERDVIAFLEEMETAGLVEISHAKGT